jgi:dienelactone hydrolase
MLAFPLLLCLAADAPHPTWFEYDRGAPLDVEMLHATRKGTATVREVAFAGRGPKDRVTGLLVLPDAPGPHPAVLYVHWLGEPATTNKTQFLKEAVGLARFGVTSLLIDAMWSAAGWFGKGRFEDDFDASVKQVVELRKAMDVLLAQPDVDPKRVAFVGHDFGAMYGVLMGAADPRPKTYVLIAGTSTFHEWYLLRKTKPRDQAAYVKQMEPLDPVKWIGALAPASVMLQFARKDRYVPKEKAQQLIDATQGSKLGRFYAAEHGLGTSADVNERFRWLSKELDLPEKPLPAAKPAGGKPSP